MSKYDDLKAKVDEIAEDVGKFYDKGNNAAGTRIRKAMQEVKAIAQDIRTEVQERKNQ